MCRGLSFLAVATGMGPNRHAPICVLTSSDVLGLTIPASFASVPDAPYDFEDRLVPFVGYDWNGSRSWFRSGTSSF